MAEAIGSDWPWRLIIVRHFEQDCSARIPEYLIDILILKRPNQHLTAR